VSDSRPTIPKQMILLLVTPLVSTLTGLMTLCERLISVTVMFSFKAADSITASGCLSLPIVFPQVVSSSSGRQTFRRQPSFSRHNNSLRETEPEVLEEEEGTRQLHQCREDLATDSVTGSQAREDRMDLHGIDETSTGRTLCFRQSRRYASLPLF
jgi:hypothetical protein